jgi:hypothetical protein
MLTLGASPLAGSADAPVVPGGVRVEGVAALVGGTSPGRGVSLVMVSDVDLRARIALSGQLDRPAATERVPPPLSAATLEQIIGEMLIAREAERVRVEPPDESDLAVERARIEQEAGGAAALSELLRRVGATRREIDAIARRRALVAAFLQVNLEGMTVVTDAEIERVYESGEHPFGDQPLAEVSAQLGALMARQAVDRAVRRWVSVLRARTEVTLLVEYGAQTGPSR